MKPKLINYAVGRYWKGESGEVDIYTFQSEVHYGDLKDAKLLLDYVKEQEPEKDWKIFVLKELEEQNEN